jgi:hypothetical protein
MRMGLTRMALTQGEDSQMHAMMPTAHCDHAMHA